MVLCFLAPFISVAFIAAVVLGISSFITLDFSSNYWMQVIHMFNPLEHLWVRVLYVIWTFIYIINIRHIYFIDFD